VVALAAKSMRLQTRAGKSACATKGGVKRFDLQGKPQQSGRGRRPTRIGRAPTAKWIDWRVVEA